MSCTLLAVSVRAAHTSTKGVLRFERVLQPDHILRSSSGGNCLPPRIMTKSNLISSGTHDPMLPWAPILFSSCHATFWRTRLHRGPHIGIIHFLFSVVRSSYGKSCMYLGHSRKRSFQVASGSATMKDRIPGIFYHAGHGELIDFSTRPTRSMSAARPPKPT